MKNDAEAEDAELKTGSLQKIAEVFTVTRYPRPTGEKIRQAVSRSLKTTDRKLVERFLAKFRQKADRLDHARVRSTLTFAECAKAWLETMTPHMKPSIC